MKNLIVAKLDLTSASAIPLILKSTLHFHNLLKTYDLAPQITTNCGSITHSINTISLFDNRLHTHLFHLSPATRNLLTDTNYNANNSKYVYPASQTPINTTLAKRNLPHFNHSFQIQIVNYSKGQE